MQDVLLSMKILLQITHNAAEGWRVSFFRLISPALP